MIKNKLAEFKILEAERKYVGLFENKSEWIDWYYRNENAFGKRFTTVIESMSDIERYVIKKRKREYIPETLTNPFYLEYTPARAYEKESAVLNFKSASRRKPELELTGKCKTEFEAIMKMVNAVNKNRTIDASQKLEVLISPIRKSLRGEPVKNSFAVKIKYPDGSISCFFHLIGMYHIATNIVE